MLLKQARYFVTVVDANSFTEAAEQLYVSQSAVFSRLSKSKCALRFHSYSNTKGFPRSIQRLST